MSQRSKASGVSEKSIKKAIEKELKESEIKTDEKVEEVVKPEKIEIFDNSILKTYKHVPPVDTTIFHDELVCEVIMEVIDKWDRSENVETERIRKLTATCNRNLSLYSNTLRDCCRFCSSVEVPIINPHKTCARCWRAVCKTCLFQTEWDGVQRNICAHCMCTISTDNRTGRWFHLLYEESGRKRITPRTHLLSLMKKKKQKTEEIKINKGEWVDVEIAIDQWNEEEKNERRMSREKSLSHNSLQPSDSSERKSSSNSQDLQNNMQPETITLSIDYDRDESTFKIYLQKCNNLMLIKENRPNAYAKVNIEPEYLSKKKKPKTKIVWDNCNPVFNELLTIRISQNKVKNGNLIVTIYNFNKQSKNYVLGEVIIPIELTLKTYKGIFQTYKLKSTEALLSSMADKKLGISRYMDTLSKSRLNFDKDFVNFFEPNNDMFESETRIRTKIKCEISNETSECTIYLYLDIFTDIHMLLESPIPISIVGLLKDDIGRVIAKTEKVVISIKSIFEAFFVNSILLFSNLDNILNFDSLEMQLQVFTDDEGLIASSYNSVTDSLKKIKTDIGVWSTINFKIRKL